MCNGEESSVWSWFTGHQTLVVFGGVAAFWLVRFMIGHKLVWFRCKFNLHRYEPWETKDLDRQREEFAKTEIDDAKTVHSGVMMFSIPRYCNDCGIKAPEEIQERFSYSVHDQDTPRDHATPFINLVSETSSERVKRRG